jgi:hypothetical protein
MQIELKAVSINQTEKFTRVSFAQVDKDGRPNQAGPVMAINIPADIDTKIKPGITYTITINPKK